MAEASATGRPAHGQRTFDCPWCGAITSIPADHLGEHFPCPECKKATKLTDKNTSALPPTATPPDAPHLSGHRTFDCPWCGAISGIESSHMGEHFHCPECKRQTKLTERNTSRRAPTEAPAGAPRPTEPPGAGRKGVVVGLVVALLALGAWLAFARRERAVRPEEPTLARTDEPPAAPRVNGLPPSAEPPPRSTSTPPSRAGADSTPATPPAETPVLPPDGVAPPPAAPPSDLERARARVADAAARVTAAERRLGDLRERQGQAERRQLEAVRQVAAESASLRERMSKEPGPDDVRAHNLALLQFLQSTPARVAAAEAVLASLREDPSVREVVGIAWQDLNFHGLPFRRALAAMRAERESPAPAPAAPEGSEDPAQADVAAARREHEEAQAALRALEAPK